MRSYLLLCCFVLLLFGDFALEAVAADAVKLQEGVLVRPASVAEGQAILTATDRFTSRLSQFDLESRVGRLGATRKDFDEMVKSQVRAWPDEQWAKVQAALTTVATQLRERQLTPPFPAEILVVYTTGKDEGNAAYCRGSAIVLPAPLVEKIRPKRANELIAHELFHILSANHPQLQKALYANIGFRQLPKDVPLPKSLQGRKITNPDGPGLRHHIQVENGDQKTFAVPLLFANVDRFDPKRGASFFDFLQFRLLAIEPSGEEWVASQKDGKPVLLDPINNQSFLKQIGTNTRYIYHPDEILADNFVFLLQNKQDLESPQIVESMRMTIKAFEKR